MAPLYFGVAKVSIFLNPQRKIVPIHPENKKNVKSLVVCVERYFYYFCRLINKVQW
jgi:hypothetical protein